MKDIDEKTKELNEVLNKLDEFEKNKPPLPSIEELKKQLEAMKSEIDQILKECNIEHSDYPKYKKIKVQRCDSE